METWVYIPIVGVAILGVIAYGCWRAAKRREAMRKWAGKMGMRYERAKDHRYQSNFHQFDILRKGEGDRYAHNIISGEFHGRDVRAFDYHYETYSTDSKGRRTTHHHHFSAVILSTTVPMKPLFIRPEGWFDSVTEFFGYDDIDFELTRFNDAFYVKGPDRRWAFDVLHQETMDFLLNQPRFTLDMEGTCLIVYRDKRFDIEDFEAALAVGEGLMDRLPDSVRAELSNG